MQQMFRCFDLTLLQAWVTSLQRCLYAPATEEQKAAGNRSAKIERELSEQARDEAHAIKLLVLGIPESGKSTLVKQMKIIHSQGFSKEELTSFKAAVMDNLLTSMKVVLQGMGTLRIALASKRNKAHARSILSCECCLGDDQELLPFVAYSLCSLWGDQGVRAATSRGHEYQLNDSALYFFENMGRIIAPNYIPNQMDVLRVRVRTEGVVQTQFSHSNVLYRMYDVGSQHSGRKKWFSYFDDIRAVLFVVALSGYDLSLAESPSLNCLQEALKLFSTVCSSTHFRNASLILFLNKTDLFYEKIMHSGRHLRLYIPDYNGPDCDVSAAAHHVSSLFVASSTTSGKVVFPHFTNATDSSDVKEAFQVVTNMINRQNLENVSVL